jgi:hypothetical protein
MSNNNVVVFLENCLMVANYKSFNFEKVVVIKEFTPILGMCQEIGSVLNFLDNLRYN